MSPPNDSTPAHTRFERVRLALEARTVAGGWRSHLYEFLLFGFKQGWACLFGALMLALLIAHAPASIRPMPWLPRYDFLVLAALAIQLGMLGFRLETWDEAKVILALPRRRHDHGGVQDRARLVALSGGRRISGSAGCRSSPASCMPRSAPTSRGSGGSSRSGSAIIPPLWLPDLAGARHLRELLRPSLATGTRAICCSRRPRRSSGARRSGSSPSAATGACTSCSASCWWRCSSGSPRISALCRQAWRYPNQRHGWEMVPLAKLGSWYLLMIISFVLVALVRRPEPMDEVRRLD